MGLYIKQFKKYVAATLASILNICEILDCLGNMYVLVLRHSVSWNTRVIYREVVYILKTSETVSYFIQRSSQLAKAKESLPISYILGVLVFVPSIHIVYR